MKPWYQSKKLWAALITAIVNVAVVVVGMYVQREELAAVLVAAITAVSGALIVAIGVQDVGKEAAAIKSETFVSRLGGKRK